MVGRSVRSSLHRLCGEPRRSRSPRGSRVCRARAIHFFRSARPGGGRCGSLAATHGGDPRMRVRARHLAAASWLAALLGGAAAAWGAGPRAIAPPATPPASTAKPTHPAHPEAPRRIKSTKVRPAPAAPAPAAQAPAASAGHEPDLAFGAYQEGHYLTAFAEATKRINEKGDAKSMTLLAELYANGLGVPNNDLEAVKWYSLAAERGDREAMFALAMFRLGGRGGPRDSAEATRLLAEAAKLGHAAAAYDLGLLYLEGQQFPQDVPRAAQLFQMAAKAGNPEAQFALETLYKDGQEVAQNTQEATRLMGLAAQADLLDAEVDYAIALLNDTGVAKDEPGAVALLRKAAMRGSPIAQDRLARVLAAGRGVTAPDPVEATKWHLIAKAGGATHPDLDDYVAKQTREVRAAGEKAAKPWLDVIKLSHS